MILSVTTLLLLIGVGIYFFFRTPIIAFSKLHIDSGEYIACNTNNPLVYFMVFCLPDALWYMSLLLVQTFFIEEKGWLNRFLVGVAISLPFLLETGQYFGGRGLPGSCSHVGRDTAQSECFGFCRVLEREKQPDDLRKVQITPVQIP